LDNFLTEQLNLFFQFFCVTVCLGFWSLNLGVSKLHLIAKSSLFLSYRIANQANLTIALPDLCSNQFTFSGSPMAITIQCPNLNCNAAATVDDSISGRAVKCKKCGTPFRAIASNDGETTPNSSSVANAFPTLPAEFGRYRVMKLLGKGGMGAVYLAQDTQLDRMVALKLPNFAATDTRRVERFVREAKSAARLSHPNICPVYDAGQINARPFISMAFVEGKPLEDLIDPDQLMPVPKAIELVRKIAAALQEAHGEGIIHRDLKPANIMINSKGEPIVMDFGLAKRVNEVDSQEAKLTNDGAIMGTPSYMPPEQVKGELAKIAAASDVYSLGVILFELLTGKTPYNGPLSMVLGQIMVAPVPGVCEFRKEIDPRLEQVCRKAMAKEPGDRYPSMAEFSAALELCLQTPEASVFSDIHISQSVAQPSKSKKPKPAASKLPIWIGLAVSLVLSLGTVFFSLKTKYGEIQIELSDPSAKVDVSVDGERIDVTAAGKSYQFKAGEHGLTVTGDGFESVTQSFNVLKGKTEIVKVSLKPKVAVAKVEPAKSNPVPPVEPTPLTPASPPIPTPTPAPQNVVTTADAKPPMAKIGPPMDGELPTIGKTEPKDAGGKQGWPSGQINAPTSPLDRLSVRSIRAATLVKYFGSVDKAPPELVGYVSTPVEWKELGGIQSFDISSDGRTIATSTLGTKVIRFVDLATQKETRRLDLPPQNSFVYWLKFSPNGRTIYGAQHKFSLHAWDVTGRQLWKAAVNTTDSSRMSVSPDGKYVAADMGGATVSILDASSGKLTSTVSDVIVGEGPMLRFSPDSKSLVAVGGGWVRFIDVEKSEIQKSLQPGPSPWQPIWSPNGTTLYTSHSYKLPEPYVIETHVESGKSREFRRPPKGNYLVAVNPAVKMLVTYSDDTLLFWDLSRDTDQEPLSLSLGMKIAKGLFTPDGKHLVVAGPDSELMILRIPLEEGIGKWIDRRLGKIAKSPEPSDPGFTPLFNGKDLTGWKVAVGNLNRWRVEAGELIGIGAKGQTSWVLTDREFDNFQLRFEYQFPNKGGAGGMMVNLQPTDAQMLPLQIMDDANRDQWAIDHGELTGTFWNADRSGKPVSTAPKSPAKLGLPEAWNQAEIHQNDGVLTFTVNGGVVQRIDLTAFAKQYGAYPPFIRNRGRIGLRVGTTGHDIRFRKIEIKELSKAAASTPLIPPKTQNAIAPEMVFDLGNNIKLDMVRIPKGKFVMGSPVNEKDRFEHEGPQHEVTITKDFFLGKYEVTQEQYEVLMGSNPSHFKMKNGPVESVSWEDCQSFIKRLDTKLRSKEGKFRLPTEAEWEYACRAGSSTRFSFGDSETDLHQYAWYKQNSGGRINRVGMKKANAFGLYDMHGNVWEWCSDWYADKYASTAEIDPNGPSNGSSRVTRSGCWGSLPLSRCRSANRAKDEPSTRYDYLGFRLAFIPAEPPLIDSKKAASPLPKAELVKIEGLPAVSNANPILVGGGNTLLWVGHEGRQNYRIYMAKRTDRNQPFIEPKVIKSISGYGGLIGATDDLGLILSWEKQQQGDPPKFFQQKNNGSGWQQITDRELDIWDGYMSPDGRTLLGEDIKAKPPVNYRNRRASISEKWGTRERLRIGNGEYFVYALTTTMDNKYLLGWMSLVGDYPRVISETKDGGKTYSTPRKILLPSPILIVRSPIYSPTTNELIFGGETKDKATSDLYILRNFDPERDTEPLK
jgi:formylglycine-generating enzyme required for sulfatase activity/serine/threonine protein kinase